MATSMEFRERLVPGSVPMRISGEDANGQRFVESTQGFLVRRNGAVLDTVQALREGDTVEITNMLNNRKAMARVQALGPSFGERVRLLVQIGEEDFWGVAVPSDSDRRTAGWTGATAAVAFERPQAEAALPSLARLAEALQQVVKEAAETSLQPAIEPFVKAAQERILETRNSTVANLEEQIPVSFASFTERLDARLAEAAANSEEAFEQRAQELLSKAEQMIQSQQGQIESAVEAAVAGTREKLVQEADALAVQTCGSVRQRLEEESGQLQKQFTDKCQAMADELFAPRLTMAEYKLSITAQQSEDNLRDRISGMIDEAGGNLAGEFKERCDQTVADSMASLENMLHAIRTELSERTVQVENELAGRLARCSDEIAVRFREQLESSSSEALGGYAAQIHERLTEAADTCRKSFMEQLDAESGQRREEILRQAQDFFQHSTDENLGRMQKQIRGFMKELGEAMVRQADVSEPPAVSEG